MALTQLIAEAFLLAAIPFIICAVLTLLRGAARTSRRSLLCSVDEAFTGAGSADARNCSAKPAALIVARRHMSLVGK